MTLTETEEILRTLATRHPGLDDVMLVTLLRAGGWEEKEIQVARTLFSQMDLPKERSTSEQGGLLALPEEMMLPAQVDNDHLLVSGDPAKEKQPLPSPIVEKVSEPQSLRVSIEGHPKRDELPHDLPLRPFETSDHIWPFSRYKEIFFGDTHEEKSDLKPATAPVLPELPEKKKEEPVAPVKLSAPSFAKEGSRISPLLERKSSNEIYHSSNGDKKLVIIAVAMLAAVLFVLGYMYSNGRI